ncbi:MAG: 2-(1,2-epoxy-1,2-dihydrophenyl)acetyl-CoA isomerase PaaG [Burkholderiales bacterium]
MTYNTLLFNIEAGIAELTLNRPDRLNSFSLEMHEELRAVVHIVETDASIRVVLLTGAGRGFCAGQDLTARQGDKSDEGGRIRNSLDENFNPFIRRLRKLKQPVICAVNGVAAGAGANLALACDITIAAESASFMQAFVKIGLIPDCGGTYFLPRLIGSARATALALLGEKISAAQAAEWGMIWRCVKDEELMDETRGIAARLAAGPSTALGLIKQGMQVSANHTLDQQLDWERDTQGLAGTSPDFAEGVAAFLDKRPAKFTGA